MGHVASGTAYGYTRVTAIENRGRYLSERALQWFREEDRSIAAILRMPTRITDDDRVRAVETFLRLRRERRLRIEREGASRAFLSSIELMLSGSL